MASEGVFSASGAVFDVLADPTRRHLIERISEDGPLTATDLAGDLPISRQAVVKHLAALAGAGLVQSDRQGREVLFTVDPTQLRVASSWLESVGRTWDRRLVALVKHLTPPE